MKKIICVLLCFLVITVFAACGAEEKTSSVTTTNSEVTVTSNEKAEDEEDKKQDENSTKSSSSKSSDSSKSSGSSNKKPSSSNKNQNFRPSSSKRPSSSNGTTSENSNYPSRERYIQIRRSNQDKFKKVGRWIVGANQLGIGLNWTCSSVEFNIDCVGALSLDFHKSGSSDILYLNIYIDGKLVKERVNIVSNGSNTDLKLTIAENLSPGVHNVKVVRVSDGDCGALTLNKIWARGKLIQAPENGSLYIEAIGDASLICWGSLLEDSFFEKENFVQATARNKANQDGSVSYPYVAAQSIGADAHIVAKQGAGIAATYHKSGGICSPRSGLLPTICEYAAASGSTKYTVDRIPDVFVIDAGAADINESLLAVVKDGDKTGIDLNRAKQISIDFLKSLKQINPNAKIIWCYGFTRKNEKLKNYISDIVEGSGGENKGVYMLELPNSARNDYPSPEDHAAAAKVLANKIKQIAK